MYKYILLSLLPVLETNQPAHSNTCCGITLYKKTKPQNGKMKKFVGSFDSPAASKGVKIKREKPMSAHTHIKLAPIEEPP